MRHGSRGVTSGSKPSMDAAQDGSAQSPDGMGAVFGEKILIGRSEVHMLVRDSCNIPLSDKYKDLGVYKKIGPSLA